MEDAVVFLLSDMNKFHVSSVYKVRPCLPGSDDQVMTHESFSKAW